MSAGPLGLAWTPDSCALFVSGDNGEVYRLAPGPGGWKIASFFFISEAREGRAKNHHRTAPIQVPNGPLGLAPEEPRIATTSRQREHEGNPQVTGLDISPDGRRLYAALGILNTVAVIDARSDKLITIIPVGLAPYRVVAAPNGKTLYVANRGGRTPKASEPHALSAGSAVRVDPKTGAALRGSISIIDTDSLTSTEVEVGRGPSGLAISPEGTMLYVANSDDDTIEVLDTGTRKITRTLSLTPAADPGFGQMPTDLALSSDGETLYVTCGGRNAVAVVSLPALRISGYIPTGWFPIALAEEDSNLFVASSKGLGARLRYQNRGFSSRLGIGTVQFMQRITAEDLTRLSATVAANNLWNKPEPAARPDTKPVPIPERVGEPSVFRHIVYIIKENHTYDLDLGDLSQGNGLGSLCLFGKKITPNEHALAQQFVLLDNTYTSGSNSTDGHEWADAAVANAYLEQNYDAYARSYPYAGGDPLALSPAGFIWNAALRAGKSIRVYGEFVDKPEIVDPASGETPDWRELWNDYQAGGQKYLIKAETDNASLKAASCIRVTSAFHSWFRISGGPINFSPSSRLLKASGEMPDLSILLLPANHTAGSRPDMPTPRAMVADNDLALGRIVDTISHSRFWEDTLILVVEDDSRFGLDHVDGHRTLAFCISPYTRRGAVVSES